MRTIYRAVPNKYLGFKIQFRVWFLWFDVMSYMAKDLAKEDAETYLKHMRSGPIF